MSQIHIVGLDHFLQNLEPKCITEQGREAERVQKRDFEKFLREIIGLNGIDLIAEEGKLCEASLGHRLADEYGIETINITMPHDERRKRDISPYYESAEKTRRSAFEQFEEYMFQRVKQKNAAVILVMCGRLHLQALKQRFIEAGDTVCTYDVNDCAWFQGVPMETPDGMIGFHNKP